jgi:hypothetical protein
MDLGNIPKNAPVATVVNVALADPVGALGKAARCLAEAGVRIDGFAAGTSAARFVTSDPAKAVKALQAGGHEAEATPYWSLSLKDQATQMARIGEALAKEGVPINDAFTTMSPVGDSKLYFKCGNPGTTLKVLQRLN